MHALKLAATSEQDPVEEELRDFAYIVSHDLATEFRHVAVFSKQLLEAPEIRANDAWRSHADIISRASDRCRDMLEQLLIYSRAQGATLAFEDCDARRLVEGGVLQLSAPIRIAQADVSIDVSGRLRGDDRWLTVAFKNIVENALQFPRAGVPPCVELKGGPVAGGGWALRVSDNGVGLERAYWEKAFRMFWRLDPEDGVGGVGAGLPISRRIVRRHRGEVRFVDHEGGACVEITVPA
jgi:signal transduction histidine kinase